MNGIQFILITVLCTLAVTSVESSILPHAHLLPAVSPLNTLPFGHALPPPALFHYPRSIHEVAPAVAPAFLAPPTAFGITATALAPAPAVHPHYARVPVPAVFPHPISAPHFRTPFPHPISAPTPRHYHAISASGLPHFGPAQIPAVLPHFAQAFAPAIPAPVGPALAPSLAFGQSVPLSVPPFTHQVNVINKFVPAVSASHLVKHFAPTGW